MSWRSEMFFQNTPKQLEVHEHQSPHNFTAVYLLLADPPLLLFVCVFHSPPALFLFTLDSGMCAPLVQAECQLQRHLSLIVFTTSAAIAPLSQHAMRYGFSQRWPLYAPLCIQSLSSMGSSHDAEEVIALPTDLLPHSNCQK